MLYFIELCQVTKSFHDSAVLQDINLGVMQNDFLVIVGLSGSGKSLLLKIMALLLSCNCGRILYRGQLVDSVFALRERGLQIGFLFQTDALFDSMTIFENVAFYLKYHSVMSSQKVESCVRECLKSVQLSDVAHITPNKLSGGMRKRVGLARAIVHRPDVVFLDEPNAGLDPITSDSMGLLIRSLQKQYGFTVISATSDMGCARSIASHIAVLREGTIYAKLACRDFFATTDSFIQENFLGEII